LKYQEGILGSFEELELPSRHPPQPPASKDFDMREEKENRVFVLADF
jgi:hypothetical protein